MTFMAPKKDRPSQATLLWLHILGGTSPSERSVMFHLSGGRAALPRVTLHPFLYPRAGFSDLECNLQFHHSESWVADPVCSPEPRSGPDRPRVLLQFAIPGRTTVFVQGRWVDFGAQAINRFYQLREDDNAEYQALFVAIEFEGLMRELTQGQGVWQRHPSIGEFTTFPMATLTPLAKVWYNFLSIKIKPLLHLSTVTKDKTILLYTMTMGLQFDIGTVIERGLIETTHGRCIGALIHPSLITKLSRSAEVQMLDSEEQVQHRLPIPLPRVKFGSPDDDETDDDETDETPSTSDSVDDNPEVPSSSTQSLADQIHALTTRFDAYWDESQEHQVALSQDMDSIQAEMAAI